MNMRVTGIWPEVHSDRLRELVGEGKSYAIIAGIINAEFLTTYSRMSALGRAYRMGLSSGSRPIDNLVTRKPKVVKKRYEDKRTSHAAKKPAFEPREVVEIRCEAIEPLGVGLMDLKEGQCRYPYGSGPFTFCGHTAVEQQADENSRRVFLPYCKDHWLLCHKPWHRNQGRPRPDLRHRYLPSSITLSPITSDEAAA